MARFRSANFDDTRKLKTISQIWNPAMRWDDPRRNPYHNSDARPPGWLLCLIAVGVALAVTVLGWVILYLRDVFSARPLG